MSDDCPGPCNAASRAVAEDDPDRPEPVPGEPIWCRKDKARIRRCLAELDDLAAILTAEADGHREQNTELGRATSDTPSPSPVSDLLGELETMLADWEWEYRAARRLPSPPRRGGLALITTTAIAWMGRHLDGILAEPRSADFGHAVTDWHRRLVAASKAGHGYRRGVVPCPRCGLKLLGGRVGDGYLACGGCNRYVADDEYADLVKSAARAVS